MCLAGIGQNINSGITNFDNFAFSMLQNFQVMQLDNWESVMNEVEYLFLIIFFAKYI